MAEVTEAQRALVQARSASLLEEFLGSAESCGAPDADVSFQIPRCETEHVACSSSGREESHCDGDLACVDGGWSAHVDASTGATYYWNAGTGATSWTAPILTMDASRAPAVAEYARLFATPARAAESAWVKHADPATGVPFFFNKLTQCTQWDVPSEGFTEGSVAVPHGALATPLADAALDYSARASFNAQTGRFDSADGQSYWDSVGRPNDREGRMMSHYFDLSTLEQNRAEAEVLKQRLRTHDWRTHAEEKKKGKVKRKLQQLLSD